MKQLIVFMYERKTLFRYIFFAILVLSVIYDFTVTRHEIAFFGDRIYGFWSIFGLIVCLSMIIFWKWLAHTFLERDENYYDN